jgi:hypothetical protein
MNEFAESLKPLFGRIGSFFDLFDLSFFVSGSVSLSAFFFWMHLSNQVLPIQLEGWLKVLAIILACYVNGLVCFAVGRWIRIPKRGPKRISFFDELFSNVLKAHGLADEGTFKEYIGRREYGGVRRLYIRLWAEVRQLDQLSPSLVFLNRYWVMAATYDGLATALFIWAIVFLLWTAGIGIAPPLKLRVGIPVVAVLLLIAYFCLREAQRFVRNQVEELVATISVQRSKSLRG